MRLPAALLLAMLLVILASPSASAHATLVRADPAIGGSLTDGPDAVTLWFSEPVELQYSRMDVLRPDGTRIPDDRIRAIDGAEPGLRLSLVGELDDGGYTVVWSTISSVDAHVSEGFFSFSVGNAGVPTAATEAELARTANSATVPFVVDATVRWLSLLGQAAIAGALIALAFVLSPVARRAGRSIPTPPFRRLLWIAFGVVVAGHLGAAVVQTMNVTRSRSVDVLGDPMLTLLTDTRYGAIWLARTALLAALALLLWVLTRRERLPSLTGAARLHWTAAVVYSGLVLLTTSIGSHAAARGGAFSLAVANDWLHLVGTAVWVGGLLALVVGLSWLRSTDGGLLRPVLARFSALAIGAIAVLVVTGVIAARGQVVDWNGIIATRYGMWFTLKLALVAATLGVGAYHQFVARPALDSDAPPRLRRSLSAEASLAIAVLIATGLLTASIPARDLLNRGAPVFGVTQLAADTSVTLRASPGQLGTNELSLVVAPIDPDAFGPVDRVYLRFARADAEEIGQSPRVELRQSGPNDPYTFRGTGAFIALEGEWTIDATIRRAGVEDLEVPFDIVASERGFAPVGIAIADTDDSDASVTVLALSVVWLLAGVSLAIAGWRMRLRQRPLAWGLFGLSAVTVSLGSVLLLVSASGSV